MQMTSQLFVAAGGLGLFLLGMIVLTDGLRALAGRSLRRLLTRFTRTPASGAATGALVTALVQSSSATTVTAVGFVGAGLLTFAQALGILFGANIGTTITGWLVAFVGFKLDLSVAVVPLVLIGVLLRLFGRGRARHVGWAIAGFSLLFLGISFMQDGLADLEGAVTPHDFPDDSWWGRLQLLAIGIGITLVTQSSSAGIASALVALGAGAISFPQAAAMVIGMDVGTTFTAALATVGGSTATRRTGYAHVIYNCLTACVAFLLLDPYVDRVAPWIGSDLQGDPQIALVAFHTLFNSLGVLLVLPFTHAFARLIVWMVPERGPATLQRLDRHLLRDADAAIDATLQTLTELAMVAFGIFRARLVEASEPSVPPTTLREGIDATRVYLERLRTAPADRATHRRHQASLHTLDHLDRLTDRLEGTRSAEALWHDDDLRSCLEPLVEALSAVAMPIVEPFEIDIERHLDALRQRRQPFRQRTIERAARSESTDKVVLERLDAFRWLLRCTEHAWRIAHHIRQVADDDLGESLPPSPPSPRSMPSAPRSSSPIDAAVTSVKTRT